MAEPEPIPTGSAPPPRRSWLFGAGLVLGLFVLGFLLPRRGTPATADLPPAPRLELGTLRLVPDPAGPGPVPWGGPLRLELSADRPGGLAVFELPGFGRAGDAPRLRHLGPLEAGPVSIPLAAPNGGDSLCLVLVLTGETIDAQRASALLGEVRQSGPWLLPTLLRELRGEPRLGGPLEPVARAYGLSAPLRAPD